MVKKNTRCTVFAKIRYTFVTLVPKPVTHWKQVQLTRQEPCHWPAPHRVPFFGLTLVRYILICLLMRFLIRRLPFFMS